MNVKKMRNQVQRLYSEALYAQYPQRYVTGINPEALARWASAWREVFDIDPSTVIWAQPSPDILVDFRAVIARRIRNAGYPLIENETQWKMDGTTGLVAVTQHRGGCLGGPGCDCPASVL